MRDAARQIDNDRSIDRRLAAARCRSRARESGSSILISEFESRNILEWTLKHFLNVNVPREIAGRRKEMTGWISQKKCISDTNNTTKIVYTLQYLLRDLAPSTHNTMSKSTMASLDKNMLPVTFKDPNTLLRIVPLPYEGKQLLENHYKSVSFKTGAKILWYKYHKLNW